ncbi:hypothetical protein RN001_009578 [Aquatica leii]|uniref:Ankyrin repeat domain-containing protein 54 n=1 Tax=Aquatica leii TaxID=1421715 RepID=A0AAN7PVI5_9COLE|nr:hypothetical protein RN001_009578 [Aquatica leii]
MSSYSDSELRLDIKNKPKKALHVSFKAKQRCSDGNIKETIKSLLKEMPIPEIRERRLLTAVSTNNTEVIEELLIDNVNPNSKDRQQRSALHLAVSKGYTEVVRLLLHFGADVNSQDIIGNTPLHLAACTSNLQIITQLLNAGADVSSLDMHGRNPLQLAESKLHILRYSWKSRTIEMIQLRDQLEQIVDVMISLWKRKYKDKEDLEMIKLSINSGPEEEVDDQMARLLEELRDFSLK